MRSDREGSEQTFDMMALIFAAMTAALACLNHGPRRLALALLVACLTLSAGLFLFEVYDAKDGFRMPWLQVRGAAPGSPA